MKSFKQFLLENKIQWNGYPEIGWWEDMDPIILYHGTYKDNKQSVLKDGLNRMDPDTGMISLTLDPNTALGYASMGGEAEFRKVGSKPKHIPIEDRIVFKFAIPKKWFLEHYDDKLTGNLHKEKEQLTNKEKYLKWSKQNPGNDQQYYALTEFRFRTKIPSKFIKGYMIKNNLKESPDNIPQQPFGLDLKAFSDLQKFVPRKMLRL